MVATRDQRRARRRTKRGGVELGVAQSGVGDAIHRGRRDDTTEGARNAVALVVGHDEKDIGRALGRYDARRPPRRGIFGAFLDHAAKRHRWRRKLLPIKRHSGTGRTRHAVDLLRWRCAESDRDEQRNQGQCKNSFLPLSVHRAMLPMCNLWTLRNRSKIIVYFQSYRGRHYAIVDAIRAVGWQKPGVGVAVKVVGCAIDVLLGASGRCRRIDRPHSVRSVVAAGGVAGVICVRCVCVRVRVGYSSTSNRADCDSRSSGTCGVPASAIVTTAAVVVHGGRWMVGAIAATIVSAGGAVCSRGVIISRVVGVVSEPYVV